MSLKDRYNNWVEENSGRYSWLSYRIFHRIADWISESTDYDSYLKRAAIDDTSRIYVAKIFMTGIVLWLSIAILSNLIVIPPSWISALIGVATAVVEATSLPLILGSIGQGIIDTIQEIIFIGTSVDYQSIVSGITSTLRSIGESFVPIGIFLLGIATLFDAILQPVYDIIVELFSSVDLSASGGGNGIDNIISQINSITPTRSFIRNVIALVIAPLLMIFYILLKFYAPIYIANERAREIDSNLPRSYTFMHALSEGGLGTYDSMKKLAESEDAYGEVSVSFQKIIRNANQAGESLSSSIKKSAEETPSEKLSSFLNGLTNAIETGSDVNSYIKSRADRALEEAREKQESRLEMYELISESYVIIFVASPVFFIILQLVQAMAGSATRSVTQMVPYLIVPVGGFLISAIVYMTGKQDGPSYSRLDPGKTSRWYDIEKHSVNETESKDKRFSNLGHTFRSFLTSPIYKLKYNPKMTLLVTVPIALLVIVFGIQAGFIPTGGISSEQAAQMEGVETEMSFMERVDEMYIELTIFGFYLPLMIILVPWSILYEMKRRRRERIISQLPQMFNSIAEANKRGLTLQESLQSTASSSNSNLYNELQKAIRRSKFTNDINGSLVRFANHMRVPRLSQSIRLLVEANKVSSNVTIVVEKIAEDLESNYALLRDRKQRARMYVVTVFVAFLIGGAVLIALDVTFFSFIVDEIGSSGGNSTSQASEASYGQDLPINFFRRVFIHTLLLLGLVSGLVSGMMENGEPQNGFKYAIFMMTLGLIAFFTVPIII